MLYHLRRKLEEWLLEEQSRWLLWVPICLALGILAQNAWPQQSLDAAAAIALMTAPAFFFWKRWPWLRALLLAGFFVAIGFIAALWQFERFEQPVLRYPSHVMPMTATLQQVLEDEDGKQKLVLSDIEVEGGTRFELPHTVRLSLKKPVEGLLAGQRVHLRGGLFPLPDPALPGGFDFARHFYFQGIGAVGFAVAPVTVVEGASSQNWRIRLSRFREQLGKQITDIVKPDFGGEVAAIANALITGERSGISDRSREVMQASGLAHMLAISGLHLGLVTGVFFVLVRYLLVLIPGLALRFPIKKWAAVAALLGGLAYLCIADFPVSAQRAYVMVALVLLAVIIDRQVLPMRSLALAAIVVLLVAPASLLGPSFQLSFAATMAIVALYEAWRRWWQSRPNPAPRYFGWLRRINLYIGGVLATTFVASLITTPYAIYHFNQFVQYHLLANMAASPVFSFIVMPSAVFAMLLLPLGWAHPFLWLMGQGIEWTLAIATAISNLPHAMLHVPTPPGWALAVFSFGVCWLCFWQNRIRHLGWLMILLSIVPFFAMRQPDILIGEKAEQIAIRLDDGGYAMWQGSVKNFKAGLWKEALDVEQFAPRSALKETSHCDAAGCILDYHGLQIALPKWREAAAEDCADTAIVITDFYTDCPGAVDRPQQAVSLWVNDSGITRREADPFSERLSVPQAAASPPAQR